MELTTFIPTIIALVSALIVLGLAIRQNMALIEENTWLRKRNRELQKEITTMVKVPF